MIVNGSYLQRHLSRKKSRKRHYWVLNIKQYVIHRFEQASKSQLTTFKHLSLKFALENIY